MKLTSLIKDVRFSKSNKFIHVIDIPMFSIFVDATLSTINVRYTERSIKKKLDEFTKARNEIHKIGFPSMHANVVISDLSGESNQNTGVEKGDVAGQSHGWDTGFKKGSNTFTKGNEWNRVRYMKIDRNSITSDVIIHEWAHLWLANNSKEFREAVRNFYLYLTKYAASKITPQTAPEHLKNVSSEDDRKILNLWIEAFKGLVTWGFKERDASMYILKHRQMLTSDMLVYLPHRMTVDAILTQPINAQSFQHRYKTLPVGTPVYAEKVHGGWIIGSEQDGERYELYLEGFESVFSYVKSAKRRSHLMRDIETEFKKSVQKDRQYSTNEYLQSKILNRVEHQMRNVLIEVCKTYNARPSDAEIDAIESWAKDIVFPKYLQILRSKKLIEEFSTWPDKVYEFLWTSNKIKDPNLSAVNMFKDIANRSKLQQYQKDISGAYRLSGKEFESHRNTVKDLAQWASSYGMSNDDELWATGVEKFFKLPLEYRKVIISMMVSGGNLPEKYKFKS